jgi:branched-subunit amino acid transport protein
VNSLTTWVVIIAIATGTFLLRFTMIALVSKVSLPEKLFDTLQYLPPAIFAALVIPAVYGPGPLHFVPEHPARLLAGLLAIVIAWKTRNMIATIVIGMLAMWVLQIWM